MRRHHKTEQEKELLALYREWRELLYAKRSAGHYVEVEPYRHGWDRYFVLRDDIKNRADAHIISKLLDLINVNRWSKRKDFKVKNHWTGKWESMDQTIRTISEKRYEGMNEKEKSLFDFKWVNLGSRKRPHWVQAYVFKYPFWFVLKTVPHMITHHWMPNAEVEQRFAELDRKIKLNNLWHKIDKLLGVKSFRHLEWDYYFDNERANYRRYGFPDDMIDDAV